MRAQNNKILKFSIRKLSFGAAPVVIGALIFGSYMPAKAYASDNDINVNYTYLTENELTESEKSLIKNSIPNDLKNNETYYMVYKKENQSTTSDTLKTKSLPNTGKSSLPLAGLGLGTAVLVVFLISKKHRNKVLSIILIGSLGQSAIVPYHSFALENKDLVEYNTKVTIRNSSELAKGVIQIAGYRYIGFFTQSDLKKFSHNSKNILSQKMKTPVEEEGTSIKQAVNKVSDVGVGISQKGESLVQPEKPIGVVSEKGEALVQPEKPIGVLSEKGKSLVQPEKPEGMVSEKGEALVQLENPEGVVSEKGESLVQPENPEGVVSEKGEPLVQPENPEGVVSEKGESLVQPENPEGVVGEKGESLVQPENPEGVVSEKGEPLVQPEKPIGVVSEKGESLVQPEKPIGVVSEKGESLVQPENPEGVVSEKGESLVQPENPVKDIPKEKKPPILTLAKIEEHTLDRSADLTYTLENEDSVEIKSIIAEVRDGENVVKRLDLTASKLKDIADNLKLYKDYIVRTTMIYNRGKVDETSVLEERPLRLDLKKVEVKNIKETTLIHVNEQGEESDSSLLNAIPENIKEYYLKVTSRDNKTTKLAVDKIEEVEENGKRFYKVSAKAQDLVQRTSEGEIKDTYSYYIAKPKSKIENVYYNFNELIKDMQENTTGIFKIGQNLNATNVTPNGKSYVTKKFTGTLISADENIKYAIHNLEHPLFNEIENGTIKNIIFSNVNINKPNADQVATIAKSAKNTVIENIKVTGSIIAGNDAAGIVNDLDDGSTMTNVAVIGKIKATGTKGWSASGLINNQRKANVERVYTNVEITGGKARGSALVSTLARGDNRFDVNKKGYIKKAVAKGTINLNSNVQTGGVISKNWPYGLVEDVVSYVKVENGEKLYGSGDIDDDDFAYPYVKNVVSVKGISKGNASYRNSNKLKEITEEEATRRVASYQITAADYEAPQLLVDKLNNKVSTDNEYSLIQDYDKTRELAYHNMEKLQPFYNKDWVVNQGNKLDENSNLVTKRVL